VARGEGITVRQDVPGLDAAHGACMPDEHAIVPAPGLSENQRTKTLCHELGHALLGHRAAGRGEEQEAAAEGTAFVVAARAGLDTSAYSFGYVTDWAGGRDGGATAPRWSGPWPHPSSAPPVGSSRASTRMQPTPRALDEIGARRRGPARPAPVREV
jgi:hypothetical protein